MAGTQPEALTDRERPGWIWGRVERYAAGAQVGTAARGGATQLRIVSGWACEMRILPDGRRQIFEFLLPGDTIDLRGAASLGSRGVVALTRLHAVRAGPDAPADNAAAGRMHRADEQARLERERRLYDHMVRIGRLSAKERVIHLLLELHDRLERVGLAAGETFKVPLTQELFADSLGLSIVHINRTLRGLRRDGWVVIKSGVVTLRPRRLLAEAACYRPESDYLERA